VSSLKAVVGVSPAKEGGFGFTADRFSGKPVSEIRHELVNAQVEVLRMYIEKQSRERLVESLDRLVECTRASFRSEEALMEFLTGQTDPLHCEKHERVLAQLASLRACAMDFDRGSLLARLIMVDRELTSHISVAAQAPQRQSRKTRPERETSHDTA
jgi:hemerythrin